MTYKYEISYWKFINNIQIKIIIEKYCNNLIKMDRDQDDSDREYFNRFSNVIRYFFCFRASFAANIILRHKTGISGFLKRNVNENFSYGFVLLFLRKTIPVPIILSSFGFYVDMFMLVMSLMKRRAFGLCLRLFICKLWLGISE